MPDLTQPLPPAPRCTPARPGPVASGRRLTVIAALLATLSAGCGGNGDAAATPAPAAANRVVAGEIAVVLRPGHGRAVMEALASANGLTVLAQFGRRPIFRVGLPANASLAAVLATLTADARVRFAEANVEAETPEGRYAVPWALYGGGNEGFGAQWAPSALRLTEAHAVNRGEGVRVAVLDSGFDLGHPVLAPRWQRDRLGALVGRDFVDGGPPNERASEGQVGYGHGTHVAGLVVLAAPEVRLMPARVLDVNGRTNAWVIAEALLWAVDPDGDPDTDDGAHVINLSLGTTQRTRLLDTVTELAECELDDGDDDDDEADEFDDDGFDDDLERCATQGGAVVLAAAGNSGSASELQYPAAEDVEGLLAVTASEPAGRLAAFANRGAWVRLAAPGEGIVSTFPGGRYATWNGTSMATPLAAGVTALLLATGSNSRPGAPPPRQWKLEDVVERLRGRAVPLCGSNIAQIDAAAVVTNTPPPARACP